MIDTVEQFVQLTWEAVHSPETVDRPALLQAASAYLDCTNLMTGGLADSSRAMAFAACDWSMYVGDLDKLRQAQHLFELHSRLHHGRKRLARLTDFGA